MHPDCPRKGHPIERTARMRDGSADERTVHLAKLLGENAGQRESVSGAPTECRDAGNLRARKAVTHPAHETRERRPVHAGHVRISKTEVDHEFQLMTVRVERVRMKQR